MITSAPPSRLRRSRLRRSVTPCTYGARDIMVAGRYFRISQQRSRTYSAGLDSSKLPNGTRHSFAAARSASVQAQAALANPRDHL